MSSANCGVCGSNPNVTVSVQKGVVFLTFSARPPPAVRWNQKMCYISGYFTCKLHRFANSQFTHGFTVGISIQITHFTFHNEHGYIGTRDISMFTALWNMGFFRRIYILGNGRGRGVTTYTIYVTENGYFVSNLHTRQDADDRTEVSGKLLVYLEENTQQERLWYYYTFGMCLYNNYFSIFRVFVQEQSSHKYTHQLSPPSNQHYGEVAGAS